MKIPNQLPQFTKENALIIVTGKQDAVLYKAYGGVLEKVDTIKVHRPQYSDNEGHFMHRGRGMVMSSGAARELDDRDVIREFISEFKKSIKSLQFKPDSLYVFAPGRIKNILQKELPTTLRKKIASVVEGNYFSNHPLYFLKKINDVEKQKNDPVEYSFSEPEAMRILEISRQARTVIRGKS